MGQLVFVSEPVLSYVGLIEVVLMPKVRTTIGDIASFENSVLVKFALDDCT